MLENLNHSTGLRLSAKPQCAPAQSPPKSSSLPEYNSLSVETVSDFPKRRGRERNR